MRSRARELYHLVATEYLKFQSLNSVANPKAGSRYSLSIQHIPDGMSKTLLIGETNYGHQRMLWTKCSSVNGQIMWGNQTWADGYSALAWGHMSGKYPACTTTRTTTRRPIAIARFAAITRAVCNLYY